MTNPDEIAHYREALEDLDAIAGLSKALQHRCTSTEWRPKVHAELLVLDHFWTQSLEFLDGDRFIACSKPACYCCYHYIAAHPGRFEVPPSHNNCWIRWRAPDIFDSTRQDLLKTREDILNAMAKKIRIEVLEQIRERRGPRANRPDSLTEISSVYTAKPHLAHDFGEDQEASSSDETDDLGSERSDVGDGGSETGDDDESEEGGNSDENDSDSDDQDDGGVLLQ